MYIPTKQINTSTNDYFSISNYIHCLNQLIQKYQARNISRGAPRKKKGGDPQGIHRLHNNLKKFCAYITCRIFSKGFLIFRKKETQTIAIFQAVFQANLHFREKKK
eukprot:TRINITY_DN4538_c0_g1_i2.p3 TRINITY_DN4538_c0_g1~~TRINITY_DN4538_c0_g1_i2.p3  ORF type:complete len:106 (+),score=3.07 TRINITY_DN4538_c0_g1_i2:550-867(+)